MYKFAVIEKLNDFTFTKVKYYSIRYNNNDVNEFLDFLNRMEDQKDIIDDLNNLIIWIEELGEKYGALEKFFRSEAIDANTSALPPPNKIMQTHKIESKNLRLYCLRANESVVFYLMEELKQNEKQKIVQMFKNT
ncbi:MAG: hypothetical protein KA792_04405 [Bacteroidales bacterium]|nr:hypothetical protein [Bacteroidales bacterium]